MVTLTFVFNKNKIKKHGYTEDALLQPMREHAQKYGISEEKNGVFSKDGEDALCVLSMFIPEITHETPNMLVFLMNGRLTLMGNGRTVLRQLIDGLINTSHMQQ